MTVLVLAACLGMASYLLGEEHGFRRGSMWPVRPGLDWDPLHDE